MSAEQQLEHGLCLFAAPIVRRVSQQLEHGFWKQKLGDFIRKIDYLKAKDGNDYEDSSQNPSNQLIDVERGCRDISFDELKDAYAAFEQKICIKNFPDRSTGGYWVAYSTANVLNGLSSSFKSDHEEMRTRVNEIQLHTMVALVQAGPNYTHCEMIVKLIDKDMDEYIKTLGVKELVPMVTAAKVTFTYTPNEQCDEYCHGSKQQNELKRYFCRLSPEQYKLVQKEIVDVYLHYASQIPTLTEKYAQQIYYCARDILDNFEERNPYLHLNDVEIIKRHVDVIKNMIYCDTFHKPASDITTQIMGNIMKAILKDGLVADIFDHLVNFIVDISKTSETRLKGKEMYDKFRIPLFRNMESNKAPVAKIFRSCCSMINSVLAQEDVTADAVSMLEDAIDGVIRKSKPLTAEDVKDAVSVVKVLLDSGHKTLIRSSENVIEHMKKIKALDWKKHTEAAKEILEIIGTIPKERMKDDAKTRLDAIVNVYRGFMRTFLDQLKKGKVLPQLQENLVKFCFDNLVISSPLKCELAEECSGRDYIDISKAEPLRLEVLQKSETLLKNKDLPWEERYLGTAISNLVKSVVESYDGNGKSVSSEENAVFVSIFKLISEGGECVVDHFYEEENDEIPNVNMKIWQNALMEYTRLHQATGTLSCMIPIMSEVLRWANIALEEDHEYMMNMCFSFLSYIGMSTPVELKSCLPEILDLMLKSEQCSQFYSLVNALYPHNPAAVHDRLQDMFDGLEDMKDNERHIVTALFQTVSTKHPEAFTKKQISMLFDMYKNGHEASNPLLLMIIKAIAEKHPKNVADFFSQLCDSSIFKPDSLNLRGSIIACIGAINEKFGQQAVDYLMKFADYSDPTVSQLVVGTVCTMVRKHKDYMQKYRPKLEEIEKTSTVPAVKDMAHDMILVLDGLSVESIAEDLQQQQEDIEELDTKVDATIDTVVNIGEKVIEHDKEIGELGEELERVEERVDDVEEDLGETKIKVEEVDNKTMTNAPKWSRDLTKLMNPTAENDWRLLASRLGYSNDDIRSWAQQHDPCMALLSEWYATHKTSEASYGVLTALTEMNRMDGVAIVENAMKAAEGVVEDEEFEYPSPPSVFISYQWGFQNEVKLLKQHLNMAGYECWLDVGQMGGGDKLFAKIDNGIRGAKIVICCVTEKYAKSPNCNREVNLSVNLNKPIIPLLMEKMDWPPVGSMGPIFSEYLFIRFFQRGGEETKDSDQRYWPIPKFQELLMQLNFFVVPDQKMVQKEYANWWAPMIEEIVVDKNKGKKQTSSQKPKQTDTQVVKSDESPLVFLSYQWGKQPQIMALYKRLTSLGYTVWMDIYQMGGGDSLYDKIDRGMRGCKAVISCVTLKYSLSANCRREISLADALKKPIIPLLLEQMKWPPDGPMSMVFTELLFINFYRDEGVQTTWQGDKFDELTGKLGQYVPAVETMKTEKPKPANDNSTNNRPKATVNGTGDKRKIDGSANDTSKGKVLSANKENETNNDTAIETNGGVKKPKPQARSSLGNKPIVTKAVAVSALGSTAGKAKSAREITANNNKSHDKTESETRIKSQDKTDTETKGAGVERSNNSTGQRKADDKNATAKTPSLGDNKVKAKVSAVSALGASSVKGKGQPSSATNVNKTASKDREDKKPSGTPTSQSDKGVSKNVNKQTTSSSGKPPAVTSNKQSGKGNSASDKTTKTKLNNRTEEKNETVNNQQQTKDETKSKSCIIL